MSINIVNSRIYLISFILLSTILPVKAQEEQFPVSMEIKIVPEQTVCSVSPDGHNLTDGYNSGSCAQVNFSYTDSLRGRKVKTPSILPTQKVSLGDLFGLLGGYRDLIIENNGILPFSQRKSAIFTFDFSDAKKTTFNVSINAIQKGKGCRGQDIPETQWNYNATIPANSRYLLYHSRADNIIPCSNVTWLVTAVDEVSGKSYKWTFTTGK